MPGPDTAEFERVLAAAREAGARAVRTVCLSGRRYENFNTLEQWNSFAADSRAKIARIAPLAERLRMPVGIENHKDWTVEEMVPLMQRYASDYLGVCIDWGNNMSLLDDPIELVEGLAPFAVNSHIKDMAVEECEDGFLLAEVPLGQGMLDLERILAVIGKHRPGTRFSLDMLTRNPLKVPCLTEKYWVTFPDRNGKYLARTLAMVRAHKPSKPLVYADDMPAAARNEVEAASVRKCLDYARDTLGMR
jgi:L-ribulose-5-phosphate 3-epimerase UlaE